MSSVPVGAKPLSDTRYLVRLLVCLGALLAARGLVLHYAQTDLFFDEAQYWAWSREPAFGYFSKPPMIAWVIGIMTGLCGDGEACFRFASPLFHSATALVIFALARQLFDARTGFWSALVYATLPGASFSSTIISTDVALLFFWACALLALVRLQDGGGWASALALGLSAGLGLLSKYAMIYFVLCAAVAAVFLPATRKALLSTKGALAAAIAVALIAPNIWWNLQNGLVTFTHTAANANWGGIPVHPLEALEFLGSQFGVFGPILFAVLLIIVWRARRGGLPEADRLLLAFSLPVIGLILVQAFLSRAHGNWAAVAYIAATVLVTAYMLRTGALRWRNASLAIHLLFLGLISVGVVTASNLTLPNGKAAFERVLGWRQVGDAAVREAERSGARGLLTDERLMTAELLYYTRRSGLDVRAWRPYSHPRDHFELTRPYRGKGPEPLLLVTLRPTPSYVTNHFESVTDLGAKTLWAGPGSTRQVYMFLLSGFKAENGRSP